MNTKLTWKKLEVRDLVDASFEGGLKDILPNRPGIYLWRRNFNSSSSICNGKSEFVSWLEQITQQPNAVIDATQLIHCVKSTGFSVGGGGLTDDKRSTLDHFANDHKFRKFLMNYVETLADFTPPIYIGEADNLLTRVKKHLNGKTSLQDYVECKLGLKWNDLSLHYLVTSKKGELSDSSKSLQELFELISQRLLSPYGTRRPG